MENGFNNSDLEKIYNAVLALNGGGGSGSGVSVLPELKVMEIPMFNVPGTTDDRIDIGGNLQGKIVYCLMQFKADGTVNDIGPWSGFTVDIQNSIDKLFFWQKIQDLSRTINMGVTRVTGDLFTITFPSYTIEKVYALYFD